MRERVPVEPGGVRDHHPALQALRQPGQDTRRWVGALHHRLRDAGQPLHSARQRPANRHQRLEALVQLSPADQHGAHLGQLAFLADAPVGLDVECHELRGAQGLVEQLHAGCLRGRPDGLHPRLHLGDWSDPAAGYHWPHTR